MTTKKCRIYAAFGVSQTPKYTQREKGAETMDKLSDGLKKVLLAGIGTVAVTAEKSKEILDEMVKKGELTVEQGKVLNQELKHNIKETVKKNVNVSVKPQTPEELEEMLGKMTPEQLDSLKEKLKEAEESKAKEAEEDTGEDEESEETAEESSADEKNEAE